MKEGSGKYVLLLYGALLGVLLPWTVGKWWYGTQKVTKEKVLRPSAASFFQDYDENMDEGQVVNVVSGGQEFQDVLASTADTGLSKIEQSIIRKDTLPRDGGPSQKDQDRWQSFDGVRRKSAALLWSYLSRKELDGDALDEGQYVQTPLRLVSHGCRKVRSRIDLAEVAGLGTCCFAGIWQHGAIARNLQDIAKLDTSYPTARLPSPTITSRHSGHRARN